MNTAFFVFILSIAAPCKEPLSECEQALYQSAVRLEARAQIAELKLGAAEVMLRARTATDTAELHALYEQRCDNITVPSASPSLGDTILTHSLVGLGAALLSALITGLILAGGGGG